MNEDTLHHLHVSHKFLGSDIRIYLYYMVNNQTKKQIKSRHVCIKSIGNYGNTTSVHARDDE